MTGEPNARDLSSRSAMRAAPRTSRPRRRGALLALVAVALAACTGDDDGTTAPSTPASDVGTDPAASTVGTPGPDGSTTGAPDATGGTDGTDVSDDSAPSATDPADTSGVPDVDAATATAAVESVSLADPATIGRLQLIRDAPATVEAARAVLDDAAAAPDARWAAVYVLANATGHGADLVPVLGDPDPTLRVLAAVGAVGQGEVAGFDVLVAALTDDTFARGIDPNSYVWELAAHALVRATGLTLGPAFDADMSDRRAAQARWSAWLAEHRAELTFDPATEEWST